MDFEGSDSDQRVEIIEGKETYLDHRIGRFKRGGQILTPTEIKDLQYQGQLLD